MLGEQNRMRLYGLRCAGKKERYSGTEHSVRELVDKAKLDVVVFR